jgi:endonuclease-3 related protein
MVGAILTQNTSWTNVERTLAGLTERVSLTPEAILSLVPEELADCLRPVGYFNLKAERLRAFCDGYVEAGGLQGMSRMETRELRERLLAIHGIGPETADDMLLYAFGRPVFVVDAYTRRILTRLGLFDGGEGYEAIRRGVERSLAPDARLFNEFHALIVRHGKAICRSRPLCEDCCLRPSCPYASDSDLPERR